MVTGQERKVKLPGIEPMAFALWCQCYATELQSTEHNTTTKYVVYMYIKQCMYKYRLQQLLFKLGHCKVGEDTRGHMLPPSLLCDHTKPLPAGPWAHHTSWSSQCPKYSTKVSSYLSTSWRVVQRLDSHSCMVAQGGEIIVELLKDAVIQFMFWCIQYFTARLPCPLLAQDCLHPHHSEVAVHEVKLEKELLIWSMQTREWERSKRG